MEAKRKSVRSRRKTGQKVKKTTTKKVVVVSGKKAQPPRFKRLIRQRIKAQGAKGLKGGISQVTSSIANHDTKLTYQYMASLLNPSQYGYRGTSMGMVQTAIM